MATSSPDHQLLLRLLRTARDKDQPPKVRTFAANQVNQWLKDAFGR